jgi:hypothetical protein
VPYKNYKNEQTTSLSHLFRVASVITYRVVQQNNEKRLHSGIIDYLYLHYPELAPSQSRALATLTQSSKEQKCLFEAIRFLHAYPYEASQGQQLNIKLDALENIIGDKSVGTQAEILRFPKPSKSEKANADIKWVRVNIIGMLSKKI